MQSEFSRVRQNELQENCSRLVSAVLAEHASPENVVAAVEYCLGRFRKHQFVDTNEGEVDRDFTSIVEKLHIHSQLESAAYLSQRRAAFLACRLSQRHVGEVHAAVLRTLLLMAQTPLEVPLQTSRRLCDIGEKRKVRAALERRNAHERAHDRRVILELELKQVAEVASRDWDDAWANAPNLPDASEVHQAMDLLNEPSLVSAPEEVSAIMDYLPSAARPPPKTSKLPSGFLPRPAWQLRASEAARKDDCGVVPEQAVVEMAVQLLAGNPSELVEATCDGREFHWRSFAVNHLSQEALAGILQPLAELATTVCRLTVLPAVLQALSPPLMDVSLCRKLSCSLVEGRFNLSELGRVWQTCRSGSASPDSLGSAGGGSRGTPALILGLCWQGAGEALQDLLEDFAKELRGLQASFYCPDEDLQVSGARCPVCTLLQLERWLEPRSQCIQAVHGILNAALQGLPLHCKDRLPGEWPEIASGELLTHLATALRGNVLAGSQSDAMSAVRWFGILWTGAMRPVLQTMDQWAATGEAHDPCGEFPGLSDLWLSQGVPPALLPHVVVSGGRQVHSLRAWAEDVAMQSAVQRRCSKADITMARAVTASPFTPLEVVVGTAALRPAAQLAQAATRPFLARLLLDENRGLLHHFAALRLVAFLEREDVVAPFSNHLFQHVKRRTPLDSAGDAVSSELNAALAESLEGKTDREGRQPLPLPGSSARHLCGRHLALAVAPEGGHKTGVVTPGCIQIRYAAPPPFDRIIDASALTAYTSVLALLLRLRHAQSTLLSLHSLPLFGISSRLRRLWPTVGACRRVGKEEREMPSPGLFPLAHMSDLLRAEMTHFLGCVERYLRTHAIHEASSALERSLLQLTERLGADDSSLSMDFDVLEQARQLHAEYLQRLTQDCLLAPSLRSVLDQAEQLIGLAAELHSALEGLVQHLRQKDTADVSTEMGAESATGVDDVWEEFSLDLKSAESHRAISAVSAEVGRIQADFRQGAGFFLKVLMFSVARGGTAPRVSDLCFQMNFSSFYHKDL